LNVVFPACHQCLILADTVEKVGWLTGQHGCVVGL
jgi:hypothetical protein